jgi:hypothetical protein
MKTVIWLYALLGASSVGSHIRLLARNSGQAKEWVGSRRRLNEGETDLCAEGSFSMLSGDPFPWNYNRANIVGQSNSSM